MRAIVLSLLLLVPAPLFAWESNDPAVAENNAQDDDGPRFAEGQIPTPTPRPSRNVQVIASSLYVRTSNKAILCSVPRGAELEAVGNHADGQRLLVRINQPGCPATGYVDSDYVTGDLMVDATNLNFRSQPKKTKDTWKCSLANGSELSILGDRQTSGGITWVKVQMKEPKKGCPSTGYVARSYLKSFSFKDLPTVPGTLKDCPDCNRRGGRAPGGAEGADAALQDFSGEMGSKIAEKVEDRYSAKAANARTARLAKAARAAAAKCRAIAPHVCKRRGLGSKCGTRCGTSRSKGWCKAGVREAIEKVFGYSLPGGSALATQGVLKRKMTFLPGVKCKDAPVGAVCLYTATYHNFGHIEIKAGKNEYCSDFCAARPTTRNHKEIGVYLP
jgi:hypothetical protein